MKCSMLWKRSLESDDCNFAYALLRVFVGVMFIIHGYGKISAGLGGFAGYVGGMGVPMFKILAPLAAYSEFVGGILLVLGLITRVASFFIFCTMVVAVFVAHAADPLKGKELAMVYMFINFMYILKGAGKYSVDYLLHCKHYKGEVS